MTFGDLIGQLERIVITCSKCHRVSRYSVRRLALAYGHHYWLAEWLDEMARDCSRKESPVAADGCGAHRQEPAQVAPPRAADPACTRPGDHPEPGNERGGSAQLL
jgi:hypothetical protein